MRFFTLFCIISKIGLHFLIVQPLKRICLKSFRWLSFSCLHVDILQVKNNLANKGKDVLRFSFIFSVANKIYEFLTVIFFSK